MQSSTTIKNIFNTTIPIATCILALAATYMPYNIASIDIIRPDIMVITLFYWIMNRPNSMFFSLLFILGIASDIFSGSLLGLHSFSYLMVWVIILYAIKNNLFKSTVWWYFILLLAILNSQGLYLFGNYITTGNYDLLYHIIASFFTVGISPAVFLILNLFDRKSEVDD
jgi:rod shape-determining protein MreD